MLVSRLNILLGAVLFVAASCWAAPETLLWEPGKVIAVDQVSTPAKEPDPSCRAVPKGATPPARCRPSNLAAEQFWRVTIDVGNKRYVVRPYRAPSVLDALNQGARVYVDPNLTPASPVEVAVSSNKTIRLRTDQGQGIPAAVDSQELLANPEPAPKVVKAVAPVTPPAAAGPRVILLENGDFVDLETQPLKSEDIGGGAALYSFGGDASPTRIGSSRPVFLILDDTGTGIEAGIELSRLQVAKGTRQMVYSVTKKRSASSLPVDVTEVSATVRKVAVKEPLAPGEYVLLLESSSRAYLFETR